MLMKRLEETEPEVAQQFRTTSGGSSSNQGNRNHGTSSSSNSFNNGRRDSGQRGLPLGNMRTNNSSSSGSNQNWAMRGRYNGNERDPGLPRPGNDWNLQQHNNNGWNNPRAQPYEAQPPPLLSQDTRTNTRGQSP